MMSRLSQTENYLLRKLYAQPDHKATFAELAPQCYYPDREIKDCLEDLVSKDFVIKSRGVYAIPPGALALFDSWEEV